MYFGLTLFEIMWQVRTVVDLWDFDETIFTLLTLLMSHETQLDSALEVFSKGLFAWLDLLVDLMVDQN
jgi:hypothetical protein